MRSIALSGVPSELASIRVLLIRSSGSACAIVASARQLVDVGQWLRACRVRASARSCCRAEHPIPAPRHASDSASYPGLRAIGRVCQIGFWRRSAGSKASARYRVNDSSSFFPQVARLSNRNCLLNDGHQGSLLRARSNDRAVLSTGAASRLPCVTLPTIAWPPSLTLTCCTVIACSPPVR